MKVLSLLLVVILVMCAPAQTYKVFYDIDLSGVPIDPNVDSLIVFYGETTTPDLYAPGDTIANVASFVQRMAIPVDTNTTVVSDTVYNRVGSNQYGQFAFFLQNIFNQTGRSQVTPSIQLTSAAPASLEGVPASIGRIKQ